MIVEPLAIKRERSFKPILFLLETLSKAVASLPLLTLGFLYLFAWRATVLIGHWPLSSLDDPKYIGTHDVIYQTLDSIICYDYGKMLGLLPLTMISFFILFPLMTMLWLKQSKMRKRVWIAVYLIGFLLLTIDPGNRLMWYID